MQVQNKTKQAMKIVANTQKSIHKAPTVTKLHLISTSEIIMNGAVVLQQA